MIGIVIPFGGDAQQLSRCLDSILRLKRDDISVCVGLNSDEFLTEIPVYSSFEFIDFIIAYECSTSYEVRNKCVSKLLSNCSFILFTDSDCIVSERWVESHLFTLKTHYKSAGPVVVFDEKPSYWNLVDKYFAFPIKTYVAEGWTVTANLGVKTELLSSRLFNSETTSGGDREWCLATNRDFPGIGYCSEAIVYHPSRSSSGSIRNKISRTYYQNSTTINKRYKLLLPSTYMCKRLFHNWYNIEFLGAFLQLYSLRVYTFFIK